MIFFISTNSPLLFFDSFNFTFRFDVRNNIISSNDETNCLVIDSFKLDNKIFINNQIIKEVYVLSPEYEINLLSIQDRNLLINTQKDSKYFRDKFYKFIKNIDKIEKIMKTKTDLKIPDEFKNQFNEIFKNDISEFVTKFLNFNSYFRYRELE